MAVILLIENRDGATVGVRFPDAAAAQRWEDEHGVDEGRGVVPIVTRTEALATLT